MGWRRNKEPAPSQGSGGGFYALAVLHDEKVPRPGRARKRDQARSASNPVSAHTAANIPTWMRENELPPVAGEPGQLGPDSGPGLGVVSIPAADGYHYGDDHVWGKQQQAALVTRLEELEQRIAPA